MWVLGQLSPTLLFLYTWNTFGGTVPQWLEDVFLRTCQQRAK